LLKAKKLKEKKDYRKIVSEGVDKLMSKRSGVEIRWSSKWGWGFRKSLCGRQTGKAPYIACHAVFTVYYYQTCDAHQCVPSLYLYSILNGGEFDAGHPLGSLALHPIVFFLVSHAITCLQFCYVLWILLRMKLEFCVFYLYKFR